MTQNRRKKLVAKKVAEKLGMSYQQALKLIDSDPSTWTDHQREVINRVNSTKRL